MNQKLSVAIAVLLALSVLRLGRAGDANSLEAAATAEIKRLGGSVVEHRQDQGGTFVEVTFIRMA